MNKIDMSNSIRFKLRENVYNTADYGGLINTNMINAVQSTTSPYTIIVTQATENTVVDYMSIFLRSVYSTLAPKLTPDERQVYSDICEKKTNIRPYNVAILPNETVIIYL